MTLKRAGLGLIALGLCLMVLSGIVVTNTVGSPFLNALSGPTYRTPMDETLSLDKGKYVISVRASSGADLSSVTVVGPTGEDVPIGRPDGSQTIDRGNTTYVGVAAFEVPGDGQYQIRADTTDPTSLVVSRDFISLITDALGWFATGFGGIVALVGGVIMLIVTGSRNRRATSSAQVGYPRVYSGQPAPGWYPDPEARHKYRWWNGHGWEAALPD